MSTFKRGQRPKKPVTKDNNNTASTSQSTAEKLPKDACFAPSLENNIQQLKDIFKNCSDLVFREFSVGQQEPVKVAIINVDGLTDNMQIGEHIMKALALDLPMTVSRQEITKANAFNIIKTRVLCMGIPGGGGFTHRGTDTWPPGSLYCLCPTGMAG